VIVHQVDVSANFYPSGTSIEVFLGQVSRVVNESAK